MPYSPRLLPSALPRVALGIDPSLSGTGIVAVDSEGDIVFRDKVCTKPGAMIPRFAVIVPRVVSACQAVAPDVVVIEGLAMGAGGASFLDLAGLHWVLRWELGAEAILQVVPPPTLKKWVSGTGTAQKQLMLMKVFKRWGEEFADDNECDAYCLAQWGLAYLRGEVEVGKKAKPAKKRRQDEQQPA